MDNTTDILHENLNFTVVSQLTTEVSPSTDPILGIDSLYTTDIMEQASGTLKISTFYGTEYDFVNITATLPTEPAGGMSLNSGQIIIAVLSGLCCLVTILGNLLVLFAFCVERRLRTYINYFIVGLSLADLVAGVFTMPIYTVYWVLGYWPFSSALCDIYLYLNHVFIHISLLAILVLAADRYQAVYHPLKHLRRRTLRHAIFMISISYIIPFLLWLPWCLLWPYIVGVRRIRPGFCYPQYVVDSLVFTILAPVCFFWIPTPIIAVLYLRIYLVIKRKSSHKKGPVMMQELESSSVSYKTRYQTKKVPNNSLQASKNQQEEDYPAPTSAGPTFDHENPGFEPNQEETTHENTFKNDTTERNQNTPVPLNTSHLHSTNKSQLPILDSIDKQMTAQGDALEAEHGSTNSRIPPPSVMRQGRESRREITRATRTLTLIFIVLIVSSLPWSILVIIYALCPKCIPLVLYQSSVYIAHMNSTVNPFCYAIANPLYLEAVKKLACCWSRLTRRGSSRR